MATGQQVEQLHAQLGNDVPARGRSTVLNGLNTFANGMSQLVGAKTLIDTVVADAANASKNEYGLEQIQAAWSSQLSSTLTAGFAYSGKTGINALAQLIADLSNQSGLDGGPNEIRLYKNSVVVPVD